MTMEQMRDQQQDRANDPDQEQTQNLDQAENQDQTQETEGGRIPGSKTGTSKRKKWAAIAVAGALLLAAGGAVGYTMPDPKASDAYRALDTVKSSAVADRDSARSSYDSIKGRYDTLLNGISDRETAVGTRETDVTAAEGVVKDAQAAVKKREDAVAGAEQKKAANTISDGTWTVGTDLTPGTYRATAPVGSRCYWAIYKSGTNGSDIVENDLPGGGRPAVTLAPGQDFNTARCGSWEKQ
ncbi:hypothetical protein IV498_02275 [Paenarthrobacter sp. Z7-10]|uniref:hypothetical protein n=1 Tax=Paenarthrobacter sp. Z7-10 TaxID=2787635 RepID=UPI0022A9ACF3|nr:hypothetical protein [Paenarthrobacter sp. Z7-10]MCZ2402038.1 hypothetical protein [Paenarthrobacter sp. Z7-10]